MYQNPTDAHLFRRYFSTDGGEHDRGPALDTQVLAGSRPQALSPSPIEAPGALPSSPAALFLSAFMQAPPAAAVQPDGEGQVVGGFTLGPIFAHGGFSTIRRATNGTGAIVAVKCVPKQRERGAAKRIAHEESIWTALSHEHILPLFACIHTPTTDFFVTQLCPAGSLFDIMRAGVPAREDAGRMFRQIVRGLRYLHTEKRLIHRDVKLENVLVDEAGVCRIADFGMARYMDDDDDDESALEWSEDQDLSPLTHNGGVHRAMSMAVPRTAAHPLARPRRDRPTTTTEEFQPGSLPYAAPELLGPPPLTSSTSMTGKTKAAALAAKASSAFVSHPKSAAFSHTPIAHSKNPGPAQDIWALGVLLYALLMGRLPFIDSFEPRLVLKILGGTYPPPTNVTPRTLAVLHGCLAPRIADRWIVERVDEAAWAVGGAEDARDDSDNCAVSSDGEENSHVPVHGHAHAAKHALPPLPLPLAGPTRDRGRPGRAERSRSRAPYVVSRTNSHSHSHSLVRSTSRAARDEYEDSRSRSRASRANRRNSQEESRSRSRSIQSESRSRSRSAPHGESRSRSRSRSPSPLTPPPPPLLGLGLGFGALGLGLGFPPGKGPSGKANGKADGRRRGGEGEEREMETETEEAGEEAPSSSLLLSPESASMHENGGEGEGRRSGSTPPGA
ncbi:kinase-like domain-containing protein [Mycena galopus ATCC 62051]|nr:kinase-like domain-containing protein [Mycena galopus ATCC 62051]